MIVSTTLDRPTRVTVIDDDEEGREDLMDSLREYSYQPFAVIGKYENRVQEMIAEIEAQNPSFVICDHRLQPKQMAQFYGVQVVKELIARKRPAMLLTMFGSSDRLSLRRNRFEVPVIVDRDSFQAENLEYYFDIARREINRDPVDQRRPHRSLIRIEKVSQGPLPHVDAVIPSWRPDHAVPVPLDCIAHDIRERIADGIYLLGDVNIGANSEDELYFHNLNEIAPSPKEGLN